LTKRSSRLKHHPGQIAFPGGKLDATDPSLEAAALRESREEVGLPEDRVEIWGRLPTHETVTGFMVTPILGQITADFRPIPEAGEVDEVFTVPLAHVLNPARYVIERRRWRGEWRRYYAVPYGPYYIWGATARILRGLAERVAR
jgi:8-oxo-dGTP pyrophosphatase MutT (NUDIX family)